MQGTALHKLSLVVMTLGGLMAVYPFLADILYQSGLRGPLSGAMFVAAGLGLSITFLGMFFWIINELGDADKRKD